MLTTISINAVISSSAFAISTLQLLCRRRRRLFIVIVDVVACNIVIGCVVYAIFVAICVIISISISISIVTINPLFVMVLVIID
jgi:hypothetical protein